MTVTDTGARSLPHNLQAEESLIGACLLSQKAIETVIDWLDPADFYKPAHGHIYDAIRRLHSIGSPADPVTVSDRLRSMGLLDQVGGPAVLVNLQVATPAISNAHRYAEIVVDMAGKRKLLAVAQDVLDVAYTPTEESADELILAAREAFADLEVDTTSFLPDGLSTLDDFLDRPDTDRKPWVVPGMCRLDWRIIVVAGEGAGKSVLLRQIAISAAAGLHPLTHKPTEPVSTLIVDLENPDESVDQVCGPMRAAALQSQSWDDPPCYLWRRPGGIDLRHRRDRAELETVLRASQPDLVCLGPVYKSFRARGKDDEERATAETQDVLDDLRTRHGFGLILEHHAPFGQDGKKREMRPHGSVLWQRWPELGIGLVPDPKRPGSLEKIPFKGDRLANSWPSKLERTGGLWPWGGVWDDGTFNEEDPEAPLEPLF